MVEWDREGAQAHEEGSQHEEEGQARRVAARRPLCQQEMAKWRAKS